MMERYPLRYGNLILERNDFLMVKKYLQGGPGLEEYTHDNVLALLRENLQKAIIMDETNMPSEIIRLYSIVSVVSSSGIEACFQLVLPDEVDLERDKISELSSLGCSVMGLSKGDII
ncbi:GreA/GreB family elongation factor [Flagellimonas sp.]|uniref:GreA/GreB family elongation factor n=1 Tax=Flagellimonas sp. TaxID=2058762 RepID=UPI003BAD7DBC